MFQNRKVSYLLIFMTILCGWGECTTGLEKLGIVGYATGRGVFLGGAGAILSATALSSTLYNLKDKIATDIAAILVKTGHPDKAASIQAFSNSITVAQYQDAVMNYYVLPGAPVGAIIGLISGVIACRD